MRDEQSVVEQCEFAPMRDGATCDEYAAPTLWCKTCWPRLADERLTARQRAWYEKDEES